MGEQSARKNKPPANANALPESLPADLSEQNKKPATTPAPSKPATDGDHDPSTSGTPSSKPIPSQTQTKAQPVNRSSWSWRAKASPVAQVARESVSVEQGISSEAAESKRTSQSVSKSVRGSRKSVPLLAEATRIHATSDLADKSVPHPQTKRPLDHPPPDNREKIAEQSSGAAGTPNASSDEKEATAEDAPASGNSSTSETPKTDDSRTQSGNWLSWWSRPDGYGSDGERAKGERAAKKARISGQDAQPVSNIPADASSQHEVLEDRGSGAPDEPESKQPEMTTNPTSRPGWFRLWSSAQNEQAVNDETRSADVEGEQPQAGNTESIAPTESQDHATTAVIEAGRDQPTNLVDQEGARPKPSGWAFWSTDKIKATEGPSAPGDTQKQIGELAVADTPSQSYPEPAQFNEQRKARKTEPVKARTSAESDTAKPSEPAQGAGSKAAAADSATPETSTRKVPPVASQSKISVDVAEPSLASAQKGKRPQTRPNLISPSFRESFPPLPNPGYLERLTSYLAHTLHLHGTDSGVSSVHPHINPTPPKVKKAIAIGIHGFFPAAVFQKVLGQPTGTSIRFANHAAASIKHWCEKHQPEIKDVSIEKVALEGEGNIAERVATLWKLLLNWLSHLRHADFILVAAHSQGVPVATMLVAKLLQLGALASNVRIGICAMAGINMGPFIEYKSRLFGSTALELFDFCDSGSKVSTRYADALDVCLRNNVRITYIGSLDDQLVSLESSLHAPVSHPYLSRAVFVDGRIHTSNFLTHLVIFSVKLRNRGISDHGLLREVSGPLAGSLVSGEGHSRLYDDPAVYTCATEFALESTDMPAHLQAQATAKEAGHGEDHDRMAARRASISGYPREMTAANNMRRGSPNTALPGIAPVVAPYHLSSNTSASANAVTIEKNPFVLPWAVRGMLEEEAVKKDPGLQAEVRELVQEFEEWRPVGKGLKDVRWRLEGVRSLL